MVDREAEVKVESCREGGRAREPRSSRGSHLMPLGAVQCGVAPPGAV